MDWYSIFSADIEKWVTLGIFIVTFIFILYRKFNIAVIALISAAVVILLGIISPWSAVTEGINWDVLAIYSGYAILAMYLRESQLPAWLANQVMLKFKKEKTALLLLCMIAMALSVIIANPEVVIILAPLAIEMADKMKGNLYVYLIALAISSNVVTTVTMVADPPAILMAGYTGMEFFDFYWFQNKISLGTISVFAILVGALVLWFQFRKMNNTADLPAVKIKVNPLPSIIFIVSVLLLAFIPWSSMGAFNHRGILGVCLGILCLILGGKDNAKAWLKEFDWNSIMFLIGIFTLVFAVNQVGLLEDFANLIANSGITSTAIYLAILIWVSVLLSAFIDNVPYTVIMLPVCDFLAASLGVNPFPFYFGILIGTGMGGNLTPVGATANVLACGMLEKRGYKITLGNYIKLAWPFTFAIVATAHVLLQIIWL